MRKKLLLLTTKDRPREYTADLKTNLETDLDCEVSIVDLESLGFYCQDGNVDIRLNSESVQDFSAVYIKHWHMAEEAAFIVSHFATRHNIPVFPAECQRIVPKTKFGETFYMALHGLPVPDSVYFSSARHYLDSAGSIVELLGSQFIFKATGGKKGADNYLVKSREQLEEIVIKSSDQVFIAQKFIDNNGDYRIINFGDDLKIAIYRTRGANTHLNNTSQGGDGELVPIEQVRDDVKDISLAAARLLGRDIAGIDVVVGKDDKAYLFEVNYSPQLTTGTYLEVKRKNLAEFFQTTME